MWFQLPRCMTLGRRYRKLQADCSTLLSIYEESGTGTPEARERLRHSIAEAGRVLAELRTDYALMASGDTADHLALWRRFQNRSEDDAA